MAYENNEKKVESVYSKRIKAGKRRTYFFDVREIGLGIPAEPLFRSYFFDVRETRGNDYYLTITESRKKFDSDGYDRHKIFLYKEDFNKFVKGLGEAVDFVKTELMPDFDFDAFNHDTPYEGENSQQAPEVKADTTEAATAPPPVADPQPTPPEEPGSPVTHEDVDKW